MVYIHLHEWLKFMVNVGKYTIYIEWTRGGDVLSTENYARNKNGKHVWRVEGTNSEVAK